MPHALISVSMEQWPRLQRVIQGYELEFQLLDDLEPREVLAQAKARRPATRRPRSKPLVWKLKFDKPKFQLHGLSACAQCGHGTCVQMKRESMDAFLNPFLQSRSECVLCSGCLSVHLHSLLTLIPHSNEYDAPLGNRALTDGERLKVRERLAELREAV